MEISGLRLKNKNKIINKWCEIAAQKKMFLGEFCLTEQDFFGIRSDLFLK